MSRARRVRMVAAASLVLLAGAVPAGSALAQLECRVRFSCIGQETCYYSLFDPTGMKLQDFAVPGDETEYLSGIALGSSFCMSRLGTPDEDCDRQSIDEDQFEC